MHYFYSIEWKEKDTNRTASNIPDEPPMEGFFRGFSVINDGYGSQGFPYEIMCPGGHIFGHCSDADINRIIQVWVTAQRHYER